MADSEIEEVSGVHEAPRPPARDVISAWAKIIGVAVALAAMGVTGYVALETKENATKERGRIESDLDDIRRLVRKNATHINKNTTQIEVLIRLDEDRNRRSGRRRPARVSNGGE
jgi:hypothetical protein